ncbi:undecaprenyl-phosphate glucose phosphotransferase [Adhaeribacter pallidiroseus]|uniref:UDP-glucose:undecaprenyl-phosphate glucose-1-phosphate transferase n=1 Tax=Adhaeribacter pallidiroseus TaxID=2072847 RepID=A0A369QP56_9BACT|nr:undecaprenyl-phosphate glucose phosphotransferase [Adhaeribacter pallidiroseus]RDC66122.1 UDP-glucose:undecaprenyl-phosphate glucose-1-phosphate transferase [Adhaeribacter pallidiroseus]
MTHKYTTYFKYINIAVDYLILNIAIVIALSIADNISLVKHISELYKLDFLLLNLFWFYCAKLFGLYNNILSRDAMPTMKATLLALVTYYIAIYSLNLAFPFLNLSSTFLIAFHSATSVLMPVWKFYFLAIRRSKRKFWVEYTRIVVLGASRAGIEMSKYLNTNPQLGYKVEGIFDDNAGLNLEDQTHLGDINDCFDFMKKSGISEVYCALPNREVSRIKSLMQEADKQMIRFKMVPDINDFLEQDVYTGKNGKFPILVHRAEPLENKTNEIRKRVFDVVFSLLVIVFVLSWLIPLLGIIIKLNSKGSVFFKQLRSGKDNKPFYCFKFRTMTENADSDTKQTYKGDMRVTKVGAFLRKTSMDELPQFINVLLGDMSVVGPRPHMLKHTEDYSAVIDKYMVRQFLTPGITGWAQVNGFRGETKETELMSKRVEADLWYLENWSFLLDLRIVVLTIWQAVKGNENAY